MATLNKKKTALFFCLTSDCAFAVASVLMDIKKYSPNLVDDILIYHDGINETDKEIINSILPSYFFYYQLPFKDKSSFHPGILNYFSEMVYAKYEPLRLLNTYSTIILSDYDIVVQADISELLQPCESGIKVLDTPKTVENNFRETLGGYDFKKKSFGAGLMVFHENLIDSTKYYNWCQKKTMDLSPYLYLPEQAIYDLLFQEFDIHPEYIDPVIYCCHPVLMKEHISRAKILHAYGKEKFWNGVQSDQWQANYEFWINSGGSKYSTFKKQKGLFGQFVEKIKKCCGKNKILGCKNTDKIKNEKIIERYYASRQYAVNKWTFNQCKKFGKSFEDFFFSETFIRDFEQLFSGLDDANSKKMKFIFIRMLALSFLEKESLYLKEEEFLFDVQENMKKNILKDKDVSTFRGFIFAKGNFTLHNFSNDIGLKLLGKISFPVDKSIIDVGAYVGDSSLILTGYTKKCVYAFEPLDTAYSLLLENIKLNNMEGRIIPEKKCLSDMNGHIDLHFMPGNFSVSTNDPENSLSKGNYLKEEVESLTLDSYIETNGIEVGIIKIDAEGAERKILAGAKRLIARDKPILMISIYHNIDDFLYIKPWIDSLSLGYKFLVNKPESTTFIEETILICY